MAPLISARRSLSFIAVAVVFAMQAVVSLNSGSGPFAQWSNTALLMVPAIYWLLVSRPGPSLAATGVMAVFLVASTFLGGAGFVAAFWVGLPLASIAGWAVARHVERNSHVLRDDA